MLKYLTDGISCKSVYIRRSCDVKFSYLQRAVGNGCALGSWRSEHGKSKKNKIKFQIVYTKIKVSSGAAVSEQFFMLWSVKHFAVQLISKTGNSVNFKNFHAKCIA